jgi:MFS transporter, PPP family, 3-phenylpropionic acid transporter
VQQSNLEHDLSGLVRRTIQHAAIQPLHGLTFALLHLANMRVLAETVPPRLAATALTLYGTVGVGAAVALLTLVSGSLYAKFRGKGSG